jgi:hypothetical protein
MHHLIWIGRARTGSIKRHHGKAADGLAWLPSAEAWAEFQPVLFF